MRLLVDWWLAVSTNQRKLKLNAHFHRLRAICTRASTDNLGILYYSTHTHTHTHIRTHAHTHTHTHIHTHAHKHKHTQARTHTHTQAHISTRTHAHTPGHQREGHIGDEAATSVNGSTRDVHGNSHHSHNDQESSKLGGGTSTPWQPWYVGTEDRARSNN
jgi:hypothetical protein